MPGRSLWDALVEVLFPRRCVGCGRGAWPFCASCRSGVAALGGPGCRRCGRPFDAAAARCADCPPGSIEWARAAYLYDGPVRRALIRLKFGGLRSVADAFAIPMAELLRDLPQRPDDQSLALTWVPLGRARRRTRGFDQAEVLARRVAAVSGLPVRSLLVRLAETSPQALRSGPDRHRALAGAFRAAARPPPRVVLVDDVLTSGATTGECAAVLLGAGAAEVAVLTAARSLGGQVPRRCYTPPGLAPGSVVARGMSPR